MTARRNVFFLVFIEGEPVPDAVGRAIETWEVGADAICRLGEGAGIWYRIRGADAPSWDQPTLEGWLAAEYQ